MSMAVVVKLDTIIFVSHVQFFYFNILLNLDESKFDIKKKKKKLDKSKFDIKICLEGYFSHFHEIVQIWNVCF